MRTIKNRYEFVSLSAIRRIMSIDARACSLTAKETQRYSKSNLMEYYVALNTYYGIVDEWVPEFLSYVDDIVQNNGLLYLIKALDGGASEYITALNDSTPYQGAYSSMLNTLRARFQDSDEKFLTLMRYLKRFNPPYYPTGTKVAIAKFRARDNRNKIINRYTGNTILKRDLIKTMKQHISKMLPWSKIMCELKEVDTPPICITPGVGITEAGEPLRTPYEKLAFIANIRPGWVPCNLTRYPMDEPEHIVNLSGVPKNYKTARLIAPEMPHLQSHCKWVSGILQKYMRGTSIDVEHQDRNVELCYYASVNGSLATIDHSSASDSLARNLFMDTFPQEFVEYVITNDLLPRYYRVNGVPYLLHMIATSGNALTFVLETIVYQALAMTAYTYYQHYYGRINRTVHTRLGSVQLPSSYGDDVIIHTCVVELYQEIASILGVDVNCEKTFSTGFYRESCGAEFFHGRDFKTIYFPRTPIETVDGRLKRYSDLRYDYKGNIEISMTSLISLQQRLFTVSPKAASFLYQLLKDTIPHITTSNTPEGTYSLASIVTAEERVMSPYVRDIIYTFRWTQPPLGCSSLVSQPQFKVTWRDDGETASYKPHKHYTRGNCKLPVIRPASNAEYRIKRDILCDYYRYVYALTVTNHYDDDGYYIPYDTASFDAVITMSF